MILPLFFLIIPLWFVGGQNKLSWCRDVLIPILIGLGIAIKGHPWLGIISCATFQIIRLGYGSYDPQNDPKPSFLASLIHDRQGAIIRLIYGVIVGVIGSLPLVLSHILPIWVYITYILINSLTGFTASKLRWPVLATDILVGAGVGSILLFVH